MGKSKLSRKFYAIFFPARFFEREISYELYSFIEYSRNAKIASLKYYNSCTFILAIRYKETYHVCSVDRGEIYFDEKLVCPNKYLEEKSADQFSTVKRVKEILDELLFSQ